MSILLQDLRFAARMLRKNPGFTAVAVVTLALGIGANTAIFTAVNATLLRPLPYPEPDRLVRLWPGGTFTPGALLMLRERMRAAEVAVFTSDTEFNLTGRGEAERLAGSRVSHDLFDTLRVRPALGRVFQAEEEIAGQDRVVILSHSLWQQMGGGAEVIGRSLILDDVSREIIGVMPAGFAFPTSEVHVWVPLGYNPRDVTGMWVGWYAAIGRLRTTFTAEQAGHELRVLMPDIRDAYPWRMADEFGVGATVVALHSALVGDLRGRLFILFGAVGLVLVIACANLANLFLAQATARRREMAIRVALGAGRLRVVRQVLAECLLVALIGALLGLAVAAYGMQAISGLVLPAAALAGNALELDLTVLIFTAALALLAGVAFGVLPALRAAGMDPEPLLRSGGTRQGLGHGRRKLAHSLVAVEVALAVVLVAGAGLLVRSLLHLYRVDPGFSSQGVMTARINLPEQRCAQPATCQAFFEQVLERVTALPGVEQAALANQLPLAATTYGAAVEAEGHPLPEGATAPMPLWHTVTPDYFQTMQIPLLSGRRLGPGDRAGPNGVVVINAAMARHFWPGEDALGKRIRLVWQKEGREIVGVVGDVRQNELAAVPEWQVYSPFGAFAPRGIDAVPPAMSLAVRTTGDTGMMAGMLRSVVASIDPSVPVTSVRRMEDVVSAAMSQPRAITGLLAAFAGLALLLAGVGVYGVIAFWVTQRTGEIGIRMALGADPGRVLRLVLRQGIVLVGIGLVAGLAAAMVATRVLESLLFTVRPTDPATYVAVALVLLGVALLAGYVPARRAARVEPLVALRQD